MKHKILVAFSLLLTVLLVLPVICAQGAVASQTVTDQEVALEHGLTGGAYYERGMYAESLGEYLLAMELAPDKKVYADWVATLLHQHSDQMEISGAELAYTYSALGYWYDGQGQYAEALMEYRRAMELAPDKKVYADWVATLLHQYSDQMEISDAELAYAYSALGYWYYGQGKHAEALMEYRRAMELAPDKKAYADWVKTLEKK